MKSIKKTLTLAFCTLLSLESFAFVNEDKPIQFNQLPQAAQTFIKSHFPKLSVTFATYDNDFADKSYEVAFSDNTTIEFDKKGNWTDIKRLKDPVPEKLVPAPILQIIKKSYPDSKVLKIEKDKNKYEVTLTNHVELTFNSKFQVIETELDTPDL